MEFWVENALKIVSALTFEGIRKLLVILKIGTLWEIVMKIDISSGNPESDYYSLIFIMMEPEGLKQFQYPLFRFILAVDGPEVWRAFVFIPVMDYVGM